MKSGQLRFYAELNDFLPADRKQVRFTYRLTRATSIKDLIESLGVPHTEVDLILVNGESADFSYRVKDGDCVSVFPMFESMDIRPLLRVRPEPLRESRFVLDVHLGRLAAYLRLAGFDVVYRNDSSDDELARLSSQQRRILLTRDRGLLKRSVITHGYWVRATRPREQLQEILRRFDLFKSVRPFQRCLKCNGLLAETDKAAVTHRLPEHTRRTQQTFRRCMQCQRVYWAGTHHTRMLSFIRQVLSRENPGGESLA
jgi:hypothetical protein